MANSIVEKFDSINQFMAAITSREENVAMRGLGHSKNGDKDFTGTKSWDEALDFLKNGWDEPLEEIKREIVQYKVKTNVTASRQRTSIGVVGYAPCVPNAIKGLPNSMITSERIPQKVKAVSIVYNVNVNCGWTPREIQKCSITVLKIVNQLELQGYRVKLLVEVFSSRKDKDHLRCSVSIKDWRQPLDLKKLCFPLVNPSMFRRMGFRWLETVPNMTNEGFRSGYGTPICSENKYKEDVERAKEYKVIGENDYFLSAYMIQENKHDVKKVMEAAGMSGLEIE